MAKRVSESDAQALFRKRGLEPLTHFPGTSKPWKSRCRLCNREISPRFANVKKTKIGCVYCAGRKVHFEDAKQLFQSAGLRPKVPFPGANKPWLSIHLACGREVSPRFSDVRQGQGGCKFCGYISNKKKQLKNSSKAKQQLIRLGFEPISQYPGSNKPWKCKCAKCGNVVSPTLNRLMAGTGCGVCAGRIVVPESAAAVMRAAQLDPLVPYPGSKKPWKCICEVCGKEVSPKYSDVAQGDGGCKFCGGNYVDPKFAYQVMVASGAIPQVEYSHNQTKWHCLCAKCGRDIYPTWNRIQQGNGPCAFCAKRKVSPVEAKKFMVSKGAEPLEAYPGAQKGWKCRCIACGRHIFPRYSEVANRNYSVCGYCAGKKVDPVSAIQFMRSRGLLPLVPYEKADRPWLSECATCGKRISPRYSAVRIGQGCKYCTNKGLDYGAPAFLYLMTHSLFGAHKIGIGNHKTRNNRLNEHKKKGWGVFETLNFSTGDEAFEVEQRVLSWIRYERNLDPYLSEEQMPQSGYTETVNASEISLVTIWKKVLDFSKVKS